VGRVAGRRWQFFALMVAVILGGISTPRVQAGTQCPSGIGPAECGPSQLVQDPAWLAAKEQGRVVVTNHKASMVPAGVAAVAAAYPTKAVLYTGYNSKMWEPPGRNCLSNGNCTDSSGAQYYDRYYFNFCGPGAAAVALEGWELASNDQSGTFTEPSTANHHSTTYWTSDDGGRANGRPYIMYMAEYVKPPSFGVRGMVSFRTYPDAGTNMASMRDALNWEASGRDTSVWSNYFYANRPYTTSKAQMISDVKNDVYNAGIGVVAAVLTSDLPNWPSTSNVDHSIAIIGYDDGAQVFYYVDTCGILCGAKTNGGVKTISYTQMWTAM
jgi:hypothetical protein